MAAIPTGAVIADKGYDSDALIETIEASGAQAIIPSRSNRTTQRKTDWHRYKARNLVERFFCRLKQFRRLATRYDKLASASMPSSISRAPISGYCEHTLRFMTKFSHINAYVLGLCIIVMLISFISFRPHCFPNFNKRVVQK